MSTPVLPTFSIPSHVVFAQVGDESILLNTSTGLYFGLDALGTRIWTRLSEGATDDEIHADLSADYDVSAQQLWADLERLLGALHGFGLISPAAAGVPSI